MSWLEALVLGIVQGLTEFLPISSSAHQSIVGQLFGGDDPGPPSPRSLSSAPRPR